MYLLLCWIRSLISFFFAIFVRSTGTCIPSYFYKHSLWKYTTYIKWKFSVKTGTFYHCFCARRMLLLLLFYLLTWYLLFSIYLGFVNSESLNFEYEDSSWSLGVNLRSPSSDQKFLLMPIHSLRELCCDLINHPTLTYYSYGKW